MKSLYLAVLTLFGATLATAQTSTVRTLLSYQGRVIDSAGVPIGNTTPVNRAVKFQLYTGSSGGTAIWAETQTVTISGGEFSVLIGNGTGISGLTGPSSPAPTPYKTISEIVNAATTAALYLGVTVDDGNSATTDAEISPRQQFVSGAYALRATVAESVASSAVTTTMIADANVTTSKIADSNVTSAKIADGTIVTADIGSGAVTAAKIDTSTVGLWSVNSGNLYRSTGNIGIGTSTPDRKLTIDNGWLGFNTADGTSTGMYATMAGNDFWQISGEGSTNDGRLVIQTGDDGTEPIIFKQGTVERVRIGSNGNVGINQASPGYPLSFADSNGAKISLWGQSTSHYGLGIQSGLLQIYSDSSGADVAFGYGSSATFTERMRVRGNGNVGIGTTSPSAPLQVTSTSSTGPDTNGIYVFNPTNSAGNNSIVTLRTAGGSAGSPFFSMDVVGINGWSMGIDNADSQKFKIGNSWAGPNNNTKLTITTGNGYVGIGTTTPVCPLDVRGSSSFTYTGDDYSAGAGWNNTGSATSQTNDVSIYASHHIICHTIQVFSDQRVKTDIHPTDNRSDLATLMGIEVSDYKYKDVPKYGGRPQKKVIAQQVEKIFPQAVTQTTDGVPDIFKKATVKDGWVELVTDLKVGERVKLINKERESVPEVLEVRDGAFRTDFKENSERLFVYGREVKDFRTVDYDAISMLNVSATQELAKQLKEKDAQIASLEARLAALEKLLTPAK